MATTLDLALTQGATFRRHLVWRQPQTAEQKAAGQPGTPYDLTGASAHMQVRTKVNRPSLLDLHDGAGITLGGDAGTIAIELTSAQTMALELKRPGVYDLFVTFSSGDVLRVVQGAVSVELAITDPVTEVAGG